MRITGLLCGVLCLTCVGAASADDQAERKVIDKAVKALGGEEKLARFKGSTTKGKGTIEAGGASVPYTEEGSSLLPDHHRFDIEFDIQGTKIKEILVVNGDKVWLVINNQDMATDDIRKGFRDYFYAMSLAFNPLQLKNKDFKLGPLGEMKIQDRQCVGVQVSQKGRPDVNLWFDRENGLPLRADLTSVDLDGGPECGHEFLFNDYKEFDGVKAATRMSWKKNGKKYVEREMTEIKPQEKVDDSVFARP